MPDHLINLQRNFVNHLKNRNDFDILLEIKSSSKTESLARLNIYRNNVFGGFESVLSEIYTQTKKKLGEKKFSEFIFEYIKKYPSKSGNLNEYGKYFPEFIKANLKKHKIAYLYELAKIERLNFSTFFLEDEKRKFDLIKFKKISDEKFQDLKFDLNSTLNLISSKFPIYSIYKNKKSSKKDDYLMIARAINGVEVIQLQKEEFLFLELLAKKKNLYQIYQIISKKNKKFDIGQTLNKFIANSVIVDFRV